MRGRAYFHCDKTRPLRYRHSRVIALFVLDRHKGYTHYLKRLK
jgi:hypothetical protein